MEAQGDYSFTLLVKDKDGATETSSVTVRASPLTPPAAPAIAYKEHPDDTGSTGLASNLTGQYYITWAPITGAISYQLKEDRGDGLGFNYNIPVAENGTSGFLTGKGTGEYRYQTVGCNDAGCSATPSNIITVNVLVDEPPPPQTLTVNPTENIAAEFTLSWDAVTSQPSPTYYVLEQEITQGSDTWDGLALSDPLATSKQLGPLTAGQYKFRIKACNDFGCSVGPQRTVEVFAPFMDQLNLACDGNCLSAGGIGFDPQATITLTALHDGSLNRSFSGEAIIWNDATTPTQFQVDISGDTAINEALYNLGVRVTVANRNGAKGSKMVYGDNQTAYISLIDSSPTVANGVVYVGVGNKVHALDQATGVEVDGWPYTTGGPVKSTPAVDPQDGTIYVGSMDKNLYALAPEGFSRWAEPFTTGGEIVSSAIQDSDRIVYIGSMDGNLYAVNPENGTEKWRYPAGAGIADTPVFSGDEEIIYVTTLAGEVHAVGRGILGPDVLVWGSEDDSLLSDMLGGNPDEWQLDPGDLGNFMRVARLYRGLLQPPLNMSRKVVTYWTYALKNRASLEEVAAAFLNSTTGQGNFPPDSSDEAYVDALYERIFPGEGQPLFMHGGNVYYRDALVSLLASGTSRAALALLFTNSQEYTEALRTVLTSTFDYFYTPDYSWAVFSCETGDEYTRDCDGDALPDWWELLFFGDIESQSGTDDADGDGVSNLQALGSNKDPCANLCLSVEEPPQVATAPEPNDADVEVSDQIGSMAGEFRVDESGAATYRIAIAAPAGTAGVAPQINLNYSSRGGHGPVGQGWSIGGLSAISRCRQTLALDGQALPIGWNENDRFCLDGQRLVLVSGSQYGAIGATYKTEVDSFVTVTSVDGNLGYPAHFIVERKDGSVSYYGRNSDGLLNDAKQTTGGGTLNWALSRFEDSVGNGIDYLYQNDAEGFRISEIRYAYGSGSTPYAKIAFNYPSVLSLPSQGYMAGYPLSTTRQLESIVTSARVNSGWQTFRRYQLHYRPIAADAFNTLSKLESIEECGSTLCLPPTVFTWEEDAHEFEADATANPFEVTSQDDQALVNHQFADINGDGCMDLAYVIRDFDISGDDDDRLGYALSDCQGLTQGVFTNGQAIRTFDGEGLKLRVLDYNADGRHDIAAYHPDLGHWEVFLATPQGSNWQLAAEGIPLPITAPDVTFVDINADGLADALDGEQVYVLDKAEGAIPDSDRYYAFAGVDPMAWSGNSESFALPGWLSEKVYLGSGDFNGDGIMDVIGIDRQVHREEADVYLGNQRYYYTQQEHMYVLVQQDGGLTAVQHLGYQEDTSKRSIDYERLTIEDLVPYVVDLNNDGLSDIVLNNNNAYTYLISNGAGFEAAGTIGTLPEHANVQFVDYNQDGLPDLVWHDKATRKLKYRLFDGSQFGAENTIISITTLGTEREYHLFADVNGDGTADYVNVDFRVPEGRSVKASLGNNPGTPNVITDITNGLGAVTTINYKALGTSGHYDRQTVAVDQTCNTVWYQIVAGVEYEQEYCHDVALKENFYSALNQDWMASHSLSKESPVLELNGTLPVVVSVESTAPAAGQSPGNVNTAATSSISYYYAEAKIQAAGRGLLGFEKVRTVDEQTGIETTTSYRQDFPYIGYPRTTEVRSAQGKVLSHAENTWQLQGWNGDRDFPPAPPYRPYIAQSVETTYDLKDNGAFQGDPLQTVITTNTYDSYGNPTEIIVQAQDGGSNTVATKTTTNTYGGTEWEQRMGRLSRTEVATERGSDTHNRVSAFHYYDLGVAGCSSGELGIAGEKLKGLLCEEIIEPDPGQEKYRLTTHYEYNSLGNQTKAIQSGQGVLSRESVTTYDSLGRYTDSRVNAYGQTTETVALRDLVYGAPTHVKTLGGGETWFRYGNLGRQYFEANNTGGFNQTLLSLCEFAFDCPTDAHYVATTSSAGGSQSKEYFDTLARPVRQAAQGFNGTWIFVDTEYDNLGRVKRKSEPYFEGAATIYWTELSYDILGRVVSTQLPGVPEPIMVAYESFRTTTTNPNGSNGVVTKTEIKNALGELVEVIDTENGRLVYTFDAAGNLRFVESRDSAGMTVSTIQMCYDRLGRKTAMLDPDKGGHIFSDTADEICPDEDITTPVAGWWLYRYNPLGELELQIDSKGQSSTLKYDLLGRKDIRVDRDADGTIRGNTDWTYNNTGSGSGPGRLESVEDSVSGYRKSVFYDSYNRVDTTTTTLGADGDHYERITYDQYGRTFQVFDAGGDGTWQRSGIKNIYNTRGYLKQVVDVANQGAYPLQVYYTINDMDQWGNVIDALQGSITTRRHFDPATGRISTIKATDPLSNDVQDLEYFWNDLGNLDQRWDYRRSLTEEFIEYDGLNRLKRSKVGSQPMQEVDYDAVGNITFKTGVGDYYYDGSGCTTAYGPHAVCATSDGVDYHYDNNGNMTSDSSGRTRSYTTFDKAKSISKSGHTTTFDYGPDRARYKRVDTDPDGNVTTTLYIGNVEKISQSDGSYTVKRYIAGVAIETLTSGGRSVQYLHKDHLGSMDVITDRYGDVVQEMSFDAWGQRRNVLDWDSLDIASLLNFDHSITTRGYTGHEMLDEVGLIHMNGRVYDPRLGRFIQVDPTIDGVTNTQGYNRYSYVHNNPLNATDPTGYFKFREIVGAVVGIVLAVYCGPCTSSWYGAFAAGAVSGAVGAAANGGNILQGALIGGVSAAAFYGVGQYYGGLESTGNQITRSIGSAAGFTGEELAQFVAQYGGLTASQTVGKIAAHALVGGVMSVLSGGKFGHGFASAGFTQALAGPIGKIGGGRLTAGARIARVSAAAVVGGTASKMTGGKFANGAITGAFSRAFNDEAHAQKESFASYFGERVMNGQVRDDIFDYGIGLAEGGASVVKGLYNFSEQAYRHLSGDTQANWEESVSGEALSLYMTNDTVRSRTNRILFNQASDLNNYSARSIGHVTGRFITGALGGRYVNTFTGVTAGVGDGAAALNRGGDFITGFIYGE